MANNPPMPPNTTCDIYRGGNGPPSPPDVAGVPCYLEERFRNIKPTTEFIYSHLMRVAVGTDVRDDYNISSLADSVYVPNSTGTIFQVKAVARVARGTPLDHLVAYLNRVAVAWPSQNV